MNSSFAILFAQQRSRMDNLSGAFRNQSSSIDSFDVLLWLLVVLAIVIVLWGLSLLLKKRGQQRGPKQPATPVPLPVQRPSALVDSTMAAVAPGESRKSR